VGATSSRSAEVLRRIYEPLTGGSYYNPASARPACAEREPGQAAGNISAKRGDHQARLKRISSLEDFVH